MGKRATAPCSFPTGYQDSKRDIAPAACPSKAFAPSSYNPARRGWISRTETCVQAPTFVLPKADVWPSKACTRTEKMPRGTTVASRQIAASPASWNVKKSITSSRGRQPYLGFQRRLNSRPSKREARENVVAYNQSRSQRIHSTDDGGDRAVDTLWRPRGLAPSAWPTACNAALYDMVSRYQLTEDQLKENGYPFPHPERSGAAILFTNHQKLPEDPWLRICCRCGTRYPVLPSGHSVRDEECRFHWGRLLPAQAAYGWETRYLCCSAPVSSAGCQVAKRHVQDGRKENLRGFVKTKEKVRSHPAQPGIYAVDCEMSYTTLGLELTRVTVVDAYMRIVFDTFVKPDNEIVDYNTKFSGVTEADLARTNVTLRDVQSVLLSLFSADTILVGHSLESDLLALKLVHRKVVDTSVLFPHHLGLRFKRSLRDLTASYLHKTIQNDKRGHDSCEDARCCLNLIYWKIQEDAKNNDDSGL